MNAIIGGVVGLVILLLGMTLSNGIGLLLGFIGGAVIRLTLITLQWECLYVLGISGLVIFPSLIEANPLVLLGVLVGSFALEPISAGMKYITNESGSLEIGSRIELEQLTRDGRVPTHIYAYYGFIIIPVLGIILMLGLSEGFNMFKSIAFILSALVNIGLWAYKVYQASITKPSGRSKKENLGIVKLVMGVMLSLGITFISVATYQGSDLSVYTVILPLVLLGLPLGKKSELKQEVIPDCLSRNTPEHSDNFITCMIFGLFNSILISTSQRQVTKTLVSDPYDQYGIEAVSNYIQFGLYFMLGWGKSGETTVMKVIESYQSLEVMFIILLLCMLWGVLIYILLHTKEVMMYLVKNKEGFQTKTSGEVICVIVSVLLIISSPNPGLGIGMGVLCLLGNVLMRCNIIPTESMMGALLLPYMSFIK